MARLIVTEFRHPRRQKQPFKLVEARAFDSGVVVDAYEWAER